MAVASTVRIEMEGVRTQGVDKPMTKAEWESAFAVNSGTMAPHVQTAAQTHVVQRELSRHIANKKEDHELLSGKMPPWCTADGKVIWGATRISVARVILAKNFDYLMTGIVVLNLIAIVYEVDQEALCYPEYKDRESDCRTHSRSGHMTGLYILNMFFLIVYTTEMIFRLYVERLSYFSRFENSVDCFVCVSGWISEALDSVFNASWFRVLRIFRLLRAMRIVTNVPELYMLFMGFIGSMRAMLFGSLLIFALLLFCSILIVQYAHPVASNIPFKHCVRCDRGYRSVLDATLTLFQNIITGDSWGEINIPVIEDTPWLGLLLPSSFLLVGVGAMNLILAVIVDRAVEAREQNIKHKLVEKRMERKARRVQLVTMFEDLDTDDSGTLSEEEMHAAFTGNEEFQNMLVMADVDNEEVQDIFNWIDLNGDGNISYMEFCDVLDDIQGADLRKTAVLNKLMVRQLHGRLNSHVNLAAQQQSEQTRLLRRLESKMNKLLDLAKTPSQEGSPATPSDTPSGEMEEPPDLEKLAMVATAMQEGERQLLQQRRSLSHRHLHPSLSHHHLLPIAKGRKQHA